MVFLFSFFKKQQQQHQFKNKMDKFISQNIWLRFISIDFIRLHWHIQTKCTQYTPFNYIIDKRSPNKERCENHKLVQESKPKVFVGKCKIFIESINLRMLIHFIIITMHCMRWWMLMSWSWMHLTYRSLGLLLYFDGCFEQQQHVSLLPVLQQQLSHLHSAPHLTVAHLQSNYMKR